MLYIAYNRLNPQKSSTNPQSFFYQLTQNYSQIQTHKNGIINILTTHHCSAINKSPNITFMQLTHISVTRLQNTSIDFLILER